MNKNLVRVAALFALLFSLAIGHASGATETSFTFKVATVRSSKSTSNKFFPDVPIPKTLPNFKTGQKVRFTINEKGRLSGPGFSMPHYEKTGDYDTYSKPQTPENPHPNVFVVYKDKKGRPIHVELYFYKWRVSGGGSTINTVYYRLE